MLYVLNLHSDVYQLFLNKTEKTVNCNIFAKVKKINIFSIFLLMSPYLISLFFLCKLTYNLYTIK